MAAAGNLFDFEVYLEQLSNGAQDLQGAPEHFRADAVTWQCYDLV
jgi:hypothetical protein